jgi:hypothetical protein
MNLRHRQIDRYDIPERHTGDVVVHQLQHSLDPSGSSSDDSFYSFAYNC